VTTISISTRPAAPRQSASAATYRRRRAMAGGVVGTTFVGIVTLFGVMVSGPLAGPGGIPASATGAQPTYQRDTVVARPGDTLWSIAQAARGDVSHDAYLDALVRLNGGASIEIGQRIILP
jgi:Tfp pilus assembly protein FimV